MSMLTITLRDTATGESGELQWDKETGHVAGFRAEQIESYGKEPWSFSPLSIGDGSCPALRSNDGMVAMLLVLGYDWPSQLQLEHPPVDDTPPGAVN